MTNTERYRRNRRKLIKQMGKRCTGILENGKQCRESRYAKLEFHHKVSRDWVACKTSRWVRLARYRRGWLAGEVCLMCGPCNKRAGIPPRTPAEEDADRIARDEFMRN